MKRPKQLPAVERKSTKCSSVPAGGRVGPSAFDWQGLLQTGLSTLGGLF